MKAIVFEAQHSSLIQDVEKPTLKSGEALIRTAACGLCHTDVEILKGNYGEDSYPVIPGHEYSGIVESVLDPKSKVQAGDKVVIDPNISCGKCRSCKKGLTNLCEKLEAYGVTRNGGFGEFSVVSTENLHPAGDLDLKVAALAEPMACVLNALGVSDLENKTDAIIFGAGPMGLLLGIALHAHGIEDVTIVDIEDEKVAGAESLGFKAINSSKVDTSKALGSYDLSIDATGIPAVAESLIPLTNSGGTVLFYGVCPQSAEIKISPFEVFRRQLKIVGSHSLNKNIPESIAVLKKEEKRLKQLISIENSLENVNKAINGESRRNMKLQIVF
ncbi:MAG: alcohol dehydrogenase catalytic domain-containing protein [Marinomonas sp.]